MGVQIHLRSVRREVVKYHLYSLWMNYYQLSCTQSLSGAKSSRRSKSSRCRILSVLKVQFFLHSLITSSELVTGGIYNFDLVLYSICFASLTKLIVLTEYIHHFHAALTVMMTHLSHCFHILGDHHLVCLVDCVYVIF